MCCKELHLWCYPYLSETRTRLSARRQPVEPSLPEGLPPPEQLCPRVRSRQPNGGENRLVAQTLLRRWALPNRPAICDRGDKSIRFLLIEYRARPAGR